MKTNAIAIIALIACVGYLVASVASRSTPPVADPGVIAAGELAMAVEQSRQAAPSPQPEPQPEPQPRPDDRWYVVIATADGCHWCDRLKADWNRTQSAKSLATLEVVSGKIQSTDDSLVKIREANLSRQEDREALTKVGVSGITSVPTILLWMSGEKGKYVGRIVTSNPSSVAAWIDSKMAADGVTEIR